MVKHISESITTEDAQKDMSFKHDITLAGNVLDALVPPLFNVWDRTVYVPYALP